MILKNILFSSLILISVNLYGQILLTGSDDSQRERCRQMHTGKFILRSEHGTTYIKRTKSHQIEKGDEGTYKSKAEIEWIDDCTYIMRNEKLKKGPKELKPNAGDEFRVTITKIKDNEVTVLTTANFSDLVREATMRKIK